MEVVRGGLLAVYLAGGKAFELLAMKCGAGFL